MTPKLEPHELFGPGYIFFPKVVVEKSGFIEWRDSHPCLRCGSEVLYPVAHLAFHNLVEKKL